MSFSPKKIAASRQFVIIGIIFTAALLAGISEYFRWWNDQPPQAIPEAQCSKPRETVEPSIPWKFQTDPQDIGIGERWFAPDFDDGHWSDSTPGELWPSTYDGVGWYRATFVPPADWGTAYLGISQVDDTARLWVNGIEQDWDPTAGDASQIVPLPAGEPLQLSLRVVDLGGPGGIKQPVRIGKTPVDALNSESYIRWLAATKPEQPMPEWARNGYYAWTFTSLPGAENQSLLGSDGAVAPWPTAANVTLWLYDPVSRTLSTAKPVFSLLDSFLPIPQTEWETSGLKVRTTLFRAASGGNTHWQVVISNETNETKSQTLLAVVRPLSFNRDTRPTFSAGFDQRKRLWLDGQPFLETTPKPIQAGAGTFAEVLEEVRKGSVPKNQNMPCAPTGDAAASLSFPFILEPGKNYELSLDFPSKMGAPFTAITANNRLEDTRRIWQKAIGDELIVIPDQTIMQAYRASIGYLLVATSRNGPRPGPLEHAKVWVRDAAYIGEALLGAGHYSRVKEYLPRLFEHQADDGRIPPIITLEGPEPVDEWDSQGQAIYLVAAVYRFNKDLSFLRQWEPHVRRAAIFLRSLRERTKDNPAATQGLLPPSKSAEDLGSPEWHHYWDDFWGIAGLEEAAFIESELGNTIEAAWMQDEAEALRKAIRASVETVMGKDPAYIPGAPEDLTSSAMARGTSPSLYPVEVFRRYDPLIMRSFQVYYDKWIAPNDGGYKHIWGQWWPYGGLGLARDYIRLGRQDIVHQILAWTLSHQTLPGTYAWAEQVSPETGGISGGDMPHAWAAASYVALIRDLLVMRHGNQLELFAGVPDSWLNTGRTVGVKSIPTEFGPLTAFVQSDLNTSQPSWEGTLTLVIEGPASPDGGFTWKLPQSPDWFDGPTGTTIQNGRLLVPSAGGTIRLGYRVPQQSPQTSQ